MSQAMYSPPGLISVGWPRRPVLPFLVPSILLQHHYVTEDSNQHKYIIKRRNDITIVLHRHNTLTFPRHFADSGEVTSGPTRHLPPGPAPFWLVVPRRTWVPLVCATQRCVVLCRYSEHCPNVGHLSIQRKCLVRPLSPKRDGGGHTSENRGVETYAYMYITYILPNASHQRVSRSTILSKNVKSPKDGSNPKLPYKGSSRGGTIELL